MHAPAIPSIRMESTAERMGKGGEGRGGEGRDKRGEERRGEERRGVALSNNLLICKQYLSAEEEQLCVLALLIGQDQYQMCLHLLGLVRQTGSKPEKIKWAK